MTSAIERAYEEFNRGSVGFARFIEENAGLFTSKNIIIIIGEIAKCADEFMRIWNGDCQKFPPKKIVAMAKEEFGENEIFWGDEAY